MTEEKPKRWRVVFASAFRGPGAQCISHVSNDGSHTLCGRRLTDAEEVVVDNEAVPDCLACKRPIHFNASISSARVKSTLITASPPCASPRLACPSGGSILPC